MPALGIVVAVLVVGALAWMWGNGSGYRSGLQDGYRLGRDHREIV